MSLNSVIGENLRNIRKQKGLSQEDFYKKYLREHSFVHSRKKQDAPSDSSIQDWMKKAENGTLAKYPIEVLSVYADIGNTSVDSIIGRANRNETKMKTLSELYGAFFSLFNQFPFISIEEKADISEFDDSVYEQSPTPLIKDIIITIGLEDSSMLNTFVTWGKLLNISNSDPSLTNMIRTWQNGIINQYKDTPIHFNVD